MSGLGYSYAQSGRLAEGLPLLEEERANEAVALRVLSEILASRDPGDPGRAAGTYAESHALAESLGMRPLVAHCHLGLGRLYGCTGKREQAREQLTVATTMCRDMAMSHWLGQAERMTTEELA